MQIQRRVPNDPCGPSNPHVPAYFRSTNTHLLVLEFFKLKICYKVISNDIIERGAEHQAKRIAYRNTIRSWGTISSKFL